MRTNGATDNASLDIASTGEVAQSPSFSGLHCEMNAREHERLVWIAAFSTWGKLVNRTSASRYQLRTRASPQGVKKIESSSSG